MLSLCRLLYVYKIPWLLLNLVSTLVGVSKLVNKYIYMYVCAHVFSANLIAVSFFLVC